MAAINTNMSNEFLVALRQDCLYHELMTQEWYDSEGDGLVRLLGVMAATSYTEPLCVYLDHHEMYLMGVL